MTEKNNTNKILTIVLAVIICISAMVVLYVYLPKEETTDDTNNGSTDHNQTEEPVTVLTVNYEDNQTKYTFPELENLTTYIGMGGKISSKTPPTIKEHGIYKGVNVTTLVKLIAGDINNYSITLYTSIPDNQTYTFSSIQGNVDVYNATNLSAPIGNGGVTMIVSYLKDGNYFNESEYGKLKIAFVNNENELLTKSSLWWDHVVSIEIAKQ